MRAVSPLRPLGTALVVAPPARPLFRPPCGDYNAAPPGQLALAGYRYNPLWTSDTQGWNGASTGVILDRPFAGAAPGAIVLLHVGAGSRDAEALGPMIDGLRARGYRFATAAEMVAP